MENKKIVYIPGWMNRAEHDGFSPALDIWGSKIDYKEKINADVVVAHSLGCHFALLNWQKHKNAKLVLVNPVFGKRGLKDWIFTWFKFFFNEGIKYTDRRRTRLFFKFFLKLRLSYELMKSDIESILLSAPKDQIIIIKGKNDLHFCNSKNCKIIFENNIKIIEVEDMGHVWKKEKIEKIINEI